MKEYITNWDVQRAALKEVMKDWSLPEVKRAIFLVTDILQEMGTPEASVNAEAKKCAEAALVENALNGGEDDDSDSATDCITVTVKNYYVTSRVYDLRIRGLVTGDSDMMEMDGAIQDFGDEEDWLYTEIDVPACYDPDVKKALENLDYSAVSGVCIHREEE